MEFQAIIMAAGMGSRMREITSNFPKCLLPVGNVPLILSPLNLLRKAGFKEAIVIVQENEKTKIQNAIENKIDIKLDFATIPKNEDWGTADSLRHVKDKIHSDILVLSCDLVSNVDLQNMANLHWSKSSLLTILLVPLSKSLQQIDVPGSKKKIKFERDIIGLDSSGRLIFVNSEADFEDGVPLKLSIVKQHPHIKVHSNLIDAHLYMIKRDLVNYIINNQNISALKGEFLPAAVKKQFSYKPINSKSELIDTSNIGTAISLNKSQKQSLALKKLAMEFSSYKEITSLQRNFVNDENKCYAFIDRESFCTRVNTLAAYADINRKISKNFALVTGLELKSHSYQRSQVDNVSMVGEDCELLEKASIKQSMIGKNCRISEKTKITNCIVMDNVHFGKECVIQNSIICNNVIIEDKCKLQNCVIGPEQKVDELSQHSNEILQGDDHLLEI